MKGAGAAVVVVLVAVAVAVAVALFYTSLHEPRIEQEEAFTAAPTRATDCHCLPGYIPSTAGGDTYTCQKLGDPTVTRKCY